MNQSCLIIVMGVSGSGKSTLGEALAARYGIQYIDADNFHSTDNKQKMAAGIPLNDQDRTPWIDAITRHLTTLKHNGEDCVLAYSGLKAKHRKVFRDIGFKTRFLYLYGDFALIEKRLVTRKSHFFCADLLRSQFDAMEDALDEHDVTILDASKALSPLLIDCDNAFKLLNFPLRFFQEQKH